MTFQPPLWLANRHLQSLWPTLWLRRRAIEQQSAGLIAASRQVLLDCGDGVRLLGWLAEPPPGTAPVPPRLAVFLHGWEGSAESLYVLSSARLLHERGFAILRLNLRDHGGTHALNRDLFHSCRLPEVVGAIARLQALRPDHALSLVGFSLGGNFCLRVGAGAAAAGIRIARIVAVCPVLDPSTTLDALERGPAMYRQYLMFKWRRSLRLKQAAWPDHYDFGSLLEDLTLTGMTEKMVRKYTEFSSLAEYLQGYAITGGVLESLEAPSLIVTSCDDPMILPKDIERLARSRFLDVMVTPGGGHCGFVDNLSGPSWIDRRIVSELLPD